MRFRKSPTFMGKYLSLYVGGGDKVVGDNEIMEGPQWSRYVGMGMLVEVPEELPPAPKPQPKPVPKVEPAPPPPPVVEPKLEAEPEAEPPTIVPEAEPVNAEPQPEGGVTKSTAGKWKKRKDK